MQKFDLEAEIGEIRVALLARCEKLGAIVAETVQREVDFYRHAARISLEEVTNHCVNYVRFLFHALDGPAEYDTTAAARTGAARARAGAPLAALLDAHRIGSQLVWEEVVNAAAARPHIGREVLIRTTARIWLAHDAFTQAMIAAYGAENNRKLLAQAAERAALVESLIESRSIGQTDPREIAAKLRLPARGPYAVVAAECPSIGKSALPGIECKLHSLGIASAWRLLPDVQVGLVHLGADRMLDTLEQMLIDTATTRVGVSSRFDDLTDTPDAVTYARIALSAERVDGSHVAIFDAEPLTIAAVSAPRVMKQIATTVFAGFGDLNEKERDILFATFRTWMKAGGSINASAERLYCHPNTVRYRLRRIEERTGKSIGRPRDLAELCLAFEIDQRLA